MGIDIQQTSEGFTLSKSEGGRTIYTIRASNAVQFKKGGKADLKNVNIVVYGKAHDRYDQIYGKEFTYDPESGDVVGLGEVHIDLQGYAEGPTKPDQAPPAELKNPIHIVTSSLSFNQKTGKAHTDDTVEFRTLQASGTATGADYDSQTNQLQLKSDVHIVTTGDNAADIVGSSGTIQKDPRQAVLFDAGFTSPTAPSPPTSSRCSSSPTIPFSTPRPRATSTSRCAALPSLTSLARAATSTWGPITPSSRPSSPAAQSTTLAATTSVMARPIPSSSTSRPTTSPSTSTW